MTTSEPLPPRRPRHPLEGPSPEEQAKAELETALRERKMLPVRLPPRPAAPYLTYALLTINTLIFAAGYLNEAWQIQAVVSGALYPYAVLQGGEWYRLVTLMFLHANLPHIVMNMIALYFSGSSIEILFGPRRFLGVYLGGGLLGSALQLLFGGDTLTVGASGAVFAVVGAEMLYFYQHRAFYGKAAQERLRSLAFLLVLNFGAGMLSPFIANWGHLGGFIGGALLTWRLGPRFVLDRRPITPETTFIQAEDSNAFRWSGKRVDVGLYVFALLALLLLARLVLRPQPL